MLPCAAHWIMASSGPARSTDARRRRRDASSWRGERRREARLRAGWPPLGAVLDIDLWQVGCAPTGGSLPELRPPLRRAKGPTKTVDLDVRPEGGPAGCTPRARARERRKDGDSNCCPVCRALCRIFPASRRGRAPKSLIPGKEPSARAWNATCNWQGKEGSMLVPAVLGGLVLLSLLVSLVEPPATRVR